MPFLITPTPSRHSYLRCVDKEIEAETARENAPLTVPEASHEEEDSKSLEQTPL